MSKKKAPRTSNNCKLSKISSTSRAQTKHRRVLKSLGGVR